MIMKKIVVFIVAAATGITAMAQSPLLKEAQNLDKQFKEAEALEKYKAVLINEPQNITVLTRITEINTAIGSRQKENIAKSSYYFNALQHAQRAYAADSNSYLASYAMAIASGKMTEVADENKKIVGYVRDVKNYADRAVRLNPNDGKSWYTLGKWHWEMVNLNWAKKAAVKALYGGLPKGDIAIAITSYEKCKTLEPYFVINFLDLAKAYQYDNKPDKAIAVLQQLVKLPTRTADDAAYKEEGKQLLQKLL
jgi:hypothetical protein